MSDMVDLRTAKIGALRGQKKGARFIDTNGEEMELLSAHNGTCGGTVTVAVSTAPQPDDYLLDDGVTVNPKYCGAGE